MSGNDKNISGYSASDLQKYWRGELPAREMHQLEKAALEDPFLADALEGMQVRQIPAEPAAFEQDLEELQTRLERRVTEKNRRRTLFFRPLTRVAAAVILLAGLGSAAYFTLSNRSAQKETVASATPAHKDREALPAAPVTTDSSAVSIDSTALATTTPSQPARHEKIAHANQPPPIIAKTEKAEEDKTTDTRQYPATTIITPRADASLETKKLASVKKDTVTYNAGAANFAFGARRAFKNAPAAGSLSPVTLGASSTSPGIDSNGNNRLAFSGIVLGEHDHPLSGASVYLNGRATMTDQHGLFNLKLRPTDSALKVMVTSVGYEQTSIALNTQGQQNIVGNNIIRLQPQHASMDEVVVVGYGTKRKETLSRTITDSDEKTDSLWLKATPVSGRLLYQDYLATASKKLLLDSTIKGDEIISFDVNKKGDLSSFRVEQSLSPAHDSSTIRLVREGPSWKLLRGRQVRTSVRVSF